MNLAIIDVLLVHRTCASVVRKSIFAEWSNLLRVSFHILHISPLSRFLFSLSSVNSFSRPVSIA